ncbi:MAG TPA: gamma-glutamyl-gamma-aminobutyrate hydrolase family protein, partial [Kofleriaceae bacterium]|nr:gamma-glutamyl-gamma-aminobutyrate hydrolase family protein [Kofleriaceae bacterium]
MATLLVDNHDSFSFNLYQLVAMIDGEAPVIVRNDELGWPELAAMAFDRIVLSPGPGRPDRAADFGVSREVIARAEVPLLGVCLGHQGIGVAHGARLSPARKLVHGRASTIHHRGDPLFDGIPRRFRAARYHSLALDAALPDVLEAIAWTGDGQVMAIRHRTRPLWGVQFHPESIATEHGRRLMENFLSPTPASGQRQGLPSTIAVAALPSPPENRPFGHGPSAPVGPEIWPHEDLSCRVHRLDTWADPERVFVTLFGDSPAAFWLDSSLIAGSARFSYMGDASGPLARRITCDLHAGGVAIDGHPHPGAFFDTLRSLLARVRIDPPDVPFDFHGGFVGYLGYEMKSECTVQAARAADPARGAAGPARRTADPARGAADPARRTANPARGAPGPGRKAPTHEGGPLVSPPTPPVKAQDVPDASFLFADRLIAFDHRDRQIYLLCLVPRDGAPGARWLETTARALAKIAAEPIAAPPPPRVDAAFRPSRDDPQYLR